MLPHVFRLTPRPGYHESFLYTKTIPLCILIFSAESNWWWKNIARFEFIHVVCLRLISRGIWGALTRSKMRIRRMLFSCQISHLLFPLALTWSVTPFVSQETLHPIITSLFHIPFPQDLIIYSVTKTSNEQCRQFYLLKVELFKVCLLIHQWIFFSIYYCTQNCARGLGWRWGLGKNMRTVTSVLKMTSSCKDKAYLYEIWMNRNKSFMPC